MVSILTLISSSSSLFSKFLETIPSSPTARGITLTFMFPAFSVLQQGPSIFQSFIFFHVNPVVRRNYKIHSQKILFFKLRLSLAFWPRLGDRQYSIITKMFTGIML